MIRWLRTLGDLILPSECEGCHRPLPLGHPSCLCSPCHAAIVPPPPPLCARCGVPSSPAEVCPECRDHSPAFVRARALGLYLPSDRGLNPLARAIQGLKYGGRRQVAAALGDLMAAAFPFAANGVVVPVPLHPRRLRARGYNQSLLIARHLARRRGLPLAARALARVRFTRAQPGLGRAARAHNLTDAFQIRDAARIAARPVVLVDDVLTTGATANACAAALLAAGAERVEVYTAGRAP